MIGAIRQGEVRFAMSTARAVLRRIRGIHGDELPVGPCCLTSDQCAELSPRGVVDALGQVLVLDDMADGQIFNGNDIELVDNGATMLMSEVVTLPFRPFMGARHHLSASLAPCPGSTFFGVVAHRLPHPIVVEIRFLGGDARRHVLAFGLVGVQGDLMLALRFPKGMFFLAKKARVGDLPPIRTGSKGFQPNIHTNLFPGRGQRNRLPLTGDRDKPFPRGGAPNRRRLGGAFQMSVIDDLDLANLRDGQAAALTIERTATGHLRKGQRVIASLAAKARIARILARFESPKERLHRQIEPFGHLLQDLGMHPFEGGPHRFFEARQLSMLIKEFDRFLMFFPRRFALAQEIIPEPTALLQLLHEHALLPFGGIDAVLERLHDHSPIVQEFYHLSRVRCRVLRRPIHPPLQSSGFLFPFL